MHLVYPDKRNVAKTLETESGVLTIHTGNGLLVTVREMGDHVELSVDLKFPEGERRLAVPALSHGFTAFRVKVTTEL